MPNRATGRFELSLDLQDDPAEAELTIYVASTEDYERCKRLYPPPESRFGLYGEHDSRGGYKYFQTVCHTKDGGKVDLVVYEPRALS